ncbi:MAG: 1,4-dihydroxy-6-naphthoate synthase [Vulcanimicrobiaceae bacterium]
MRELTLAYSPCPNDTYIFAALTNGMLPGAPEARVTLRDIDELNAAAARAEFELVKVSYGAIPSLVGNYRIMRSGGALGRGCGPLVVARPGSFASLRQIKGKRVAIPGELTTAYLLLRMAVENGVDATVMRFDTIVAAVARGDVDAGLIIHESRFTYRNEGLVEVADLGAWWERETEMPIPLGAILVRNDIADEAALLLDDAVRQSLAFARNNEAAIMPYVREHAFEMSDDVMRAHIATYVNEYSDDVGQDGIAAVRELFARGRARGLVAPGAEPAFL